MSIFTGYLKQVSGLLRAWSSRFWLQLMSLCWHMLLCLCGCIKYLFVVTLSRYANVGNYWEDSRHRRLLQKSAIDTEVHAIMSTKRCQMHSKNMQQSNEKYSYRLPQQWFFFIDFGLLRSPYIKISYWFSFSKAFSFYWLTLRYVLKLYNVAYIWLSMRKQQGTYVHPAHWKADKLLHVAV